MWNGIFGGRKEKCFPSIKYSFFFRSFIDSLSSFIRSSSLNHCSLVAKCSRRCRATEKTFPKTNDYNDFLRSALLWWKNLNPTREKLLVHLTECFPEASDDDEKKKMSKESTIVSPARLAVFCVGQMTYKHVSPSPLSKLLGQLTKTTYFAMMEWCRGRRASEQTKAKRGARRSKSGNEWLALASGKFHPDTLWKKMSSN